MLLFLAIIAIAIVRLHNLFAVVMLLSIYSLLMASIFVVLDAVDVAFTEAAVGAGISTVLMLSTLSLTASREKIHNHTPILPIIIVAATGALLIYGTLGMPEFGSALAPIHQHVAPRYIQVSPIEVGMPNMVTSILASYRGYDTLGELTVIFTAGIAVLLLLRVRRRRTAPDTKPTTSKPTSSKPNLRKADARGTSDA